MSNLYIILIFLFCFTALGINTVELSGQYIESARYKQGNKQIVEFNYTVPGEYYLKETSPVYQKLKVEITEDSANEVTFRILNELDTFEIPHEFPFPYNKEQTGLPNYSYTVNQDGSFFKLQRDNGRTIFDLKTATVLSLLYSEIHASLESAYIWGMGERRLESYKLPDGEFTIWNHDFADFDHHNKGEQMYGAQPVMMQNINNLYHIMNFRTSRPMTVQKTTNELVFRVTGGIIELKFFIGLDSPKALIKQYHRYVNGWSLHPFWSAGWHQSRWGYSNSQVLKDVVQKYKENNLPLEVIWSDLDYMKDRKDFTLDETIFPRADIQYLTNRSRDDGLHWVPIVDPGIAIDSDCGRDLVASNAYMTSNKQNKTPYVGVVWPGDVYFADFNHYNASDLWHQCQIDWQKKYDIHPSGIWIDMNELANFVDGEKEKSTTKLNPNVFSLTDLPWDAMGTITLESHTVAIDGLHTGNGRYFRGLDFVQELDFHNFNGFLEAIATKESQERIHGTQLTFILTRAQTFGSGRFAAHWFGDNGSSWEWLKSSIAAMFHFNIYGIPFNGDDICGFNGNTTPQLCARWIQLGAFYPFARSHNAITMDSQEPYVFSKYPYVLESARKSIQLRYAFLKYYYTLFVEQRDNEIGAGAGTIVDPLFHRYSDQVLLDIDTQFMIGNLIIIPIVEEQKQDLTYSERQYYVPAGAIWYSLEDGKKLANGWSTLRRNFNDAAFVALNEGSVIAQSDITGIQRLRHMTNDISLIVVLSENGTASGQYMSIASFEEQNVEKRCWTNQSTCIRQIQVLLKKGVLVFTNTSFTNDKSEDILIKEIVLYYQEKIRRITINVSSLTKQWQVSL